MTSWEVLVSGRVQGVGFRRYVQKCAYSSGISGFAHNLVDGSVFILAQGEDDDFETFCSLIRDGNRFIQVQNLYINKVDSAIEFDEFAIH